jgi:hypothetical protein
MLQPPAINPDSTDGRAHRRSIASVLNTVAERLFKPAPVLLNTAATDASQAIDCTGGIVLIVGFIKAGAVAPTVTLKRGATTIATYGNAPGGQNIPIVRLDTPGIGRFTYSTDSGGNTVAAELQVVELK